jgi:hypothetical protein
MLQFPVPEQHFAYFTNSDYQPFDFCAFHHKRRNYFVLFSFRKQQQLVNLCTLFLCDADDLTYHLGN